MIHDTKLFVRRLAYTPWLLVAGLVLGWTGMAAAQGDGISVADVTEDENVSGGTMDFTVILSIPMGHPVTVDYQASSLSGNTASVGVDYTAIPGTITFAANTQEQTISIPITDDALYEGDDPETFTLTLSNAMTASEDEPESVNLVDAVATGTITDNETAPVVAVAAGAHEAGQTPAHNEGNPVLFVVTLTPAGGTTTTMPVTVAYTTKDNDPATANDAKAGTDYTMASGTLTFAALAAAATQTVSVETIENANDLTTDLTFTLELSSPVNAIFDGDPEPATISNTGTITDDDDATTLKVGVGDATASENSVMQFPVTLTGTSFQEVTVTYSVASPPGSATGGAIGTANIDYVTATGATLTIAAGQTSGTIYVPILADDLVEEDETFTVTLTAATNAALAVAADAPLSVTGTGTISGQLPALSVSGMSVDEADDAELEFTVSLDAATTEDVTVQYRTVDGSATAGEDYTATSGMLTIAAGDTEGMVSVAIMNDDVEEGDENFSLTLSSPTNATLADDDASAMGTINANDVPPPLPSLRVSAASAVEGAAVMFEVELSAAATGEVTFEYEISIEADDMSEPEDFTDFMGGSGTMTIAAGDTEAMVSVMTEDDDADESSETFTVTLSSPTGATIATASAKGTITDNDLVSVSVSAGDPVVEGGAVEFTIELSAATDEDVTVDYMTADGTATAGEDYTAAEGMATIAAGETSAMVSVMTIDDAAEESAEPETFTLTLSNAMGATLADADASAQGVITDNESPSLSVSAASAVEGAAVVFEVMLSKASGVAQEFSYGISIEADDTATPDDFEDFMGGSGTMTIAAGEISAMVSVMTADDDAVEKSETFTLTVGAALTAKGTITDNDSPSVSVSDASADEGDAVVFTVTLSVEDDVATMLDYATSIGDDDTAKQADFTATSGTLTIAAGDTEGMVSVPTVDDAEEEAVTPETFTLTVGGVTATGSIVDNESPMVSVSDGSAVEGSDVEFTVTLSKTSAENVVFPYRISLEGTDTASQSDFANFAGAAGSVTIPAGSTSAMVSVMTRDDAGVEDDETFTLTVGGLTATGTITDNDVATPAPTGAITLTVSPASVREDAGATDLTVKAKVGANVTADTYVALSLVSDEQLNTRFRITLPNLTIPKDKAEIEGTITFTPIATKGTDDTDLSITIMANSGVDFGSATITLIDADKPSTDIALSFDKGSISEEEGPVDIVVTATLNGAVQTSALTFALVIDETAAATAAAANAKEEMAVRDIDYTTLSLPSLTIPKRKLSGSTTIRIDPRSRERGEIDAVLVGIGASDPSLNDGAITVNPGIIKINDTPLASIKGLTATPSTIREDAGETEIALKVELTAALPNDEEVLFTIMDNAADIEGAVNAERDVNYTAIVGDLTIPAGSTTGTTTLTLTPFNNEARGSALGLKVRAKVGENNLEANIKIVDDETPTTNIALSVAPAEVKADTGANEITVTGEIDGSKFDDPVNISLVLAPKDSDGATAQRDTDYTAMLRSLTIPAGEIRGSTTISVTALTGGDKKVVVKALKSPVKNDDDDDVTVGTATITLKDADPAVEPEDPGALRFSALPGDAEGVKDTAFNMELPGAEGGEGDRTYSVSANLPAGLSFDESTRVISGSPTTVGKARVVYTVIDTKGNSAATQFSIDVAAASPPTVAVASVEASQKSIRESGDATEISITATLSGAAPAAETVEFRLGAPSSGAEAIRDVDYAASLGGSVAIEAGATEASTTLTLTPIDDATVDGNKFLGVQASASGGSASVDIKIADDETASTSIALSADPHTVSEADGVTDIVVTATLDGKVLDAEAIVTISIDPASKATRDEDYAALFNPRLTIPAGSISGSIALIINPNEDSMDEGNETITLNGVSAGLTVESGTITIADGMMPDDPMMDPLAFADGAMINDVASTAGTAVSAMELPAASGGEGDITYSVSELPAGLTFDAATRTVSGTPEAEGTTEVTYTATDGAGATVTLTFSITVNPMLNFGDLSGLFGAFSGGAGKANPASEHDEGAIQIVVGQPYSLTIPEIPGGTPPKTYSVSGLPAGLSFDPATRTVSGTPTEVGLAAVVLTVVDAAGASGAVPIPVSVIEPPLGAPSNLVAQDYAGADGQGDQGGFLLLTWELSEHHDEIDGYRIFRALPVLGNEMVPWAMVDAVPGVARGVAIVATLDNVSTRWGIAAERGGQTTHGAAKAVFVSAENQPYAQMAETLMASMEAAQAGDAPVFASLLPEALAYAQGVAPKLNVVAGVQSSEVIFTDEPVRAIDNIAPLAVPSLSVLDAPNDQGSRIALTWTLSPSDRILQDVVAGAVGPLGAEPVVGVYGYNIYRRAAGEDEFAKIAQVDAGVTSFVDETALNGVRYTYQVRPYDLDNETGSDIEQTAMAVRNIAVDSEGRALFGLFGADNRIGFDDFFIFADSFGLTAEDTGFDPAFDLSPNATIDFEDFFVFADNFGRSTAAAGKRVPMFAGLNADARMYLDARTALPSVDEDFVLDVRLADFAAIKGYGLQVAYEADKLEFVQVLTDEPLGGSAFATPQVLADEAGVLTVVAHGDVVSDGEVALSLVFRPTTEIENTLIEIADNQTYDSAFGFNRLALPAPVQLQTRPAVFALANNYPNPFNPATTIKYALPQAADVELTVYNVVGQVVRTLVAEHQSAGRYVVEWDATNDNGHSLSSGMYFYRLQAGGEFHEVKKMLLLK